MNSNAIILHKFQRDILKKMIVKRESRFNELLIDGLASEHVNYHLKKLISFGLVGKISGRYVLTDMGKDYSNLMDDEIKMIEKQPKTSVVVRAVRVNPDTGEVEHLLNKRLREPYFGKVGHITGKVRFGEKIEEAAARELMEETGLKAGRVEIEGIYRKMRHREDGSFVQDVFFYCSFVKDLSGEMIKRTEYQENFWLSETEYKRRYDIDLYDDFEWHNDVECRSFGFIENVDQAEDAF